MAQSAHRAQNCGVQTDLAINNALQGEKLGEIGEGIVRFLLSLIQLLNC